jgi:prevent-host-death family protein
MTQVMPVTQARKNLLQLVDIVEEEYARVDLTKNGRVKATLISTDYLDSLEETIYSLKYSIKDIRKAEKEIARGSFITLEQLQKQLKKNAR